MGTEIISYEDCERTNTNLLLKRFWGGKDRGTCFALRLKNAVQDHLEITEEEMEYLIYKVLKKQYDELMDKDTLYDGHLEFIFAAKFLIRYYEQRKVLFDVSDNE